MGYFVYLYKIGFGSATSIPVKQSFPVLSLHSPFAIFVKNRMRLGNVKVRKSSPFRFVAVMVFHYIDDGRLEEP